MLAAMMARMKAALRVGLPSQASTQHQGSACRTVAFQLTSTSCGNLHMTRWALSASQWKLYSAHGVTLPAPSAPPITTSRPTARHRVAGRRSPARGNT